jgi:hypothetical protein
VGYRILDPTGTAAVAMMVLARGSAKVARKNTLAQRITPVF